MQPTQRESTFTKTYRKKDGTITEKQYKTKYYVKDKTRQNLAKEIKSKLGDASTDQLKSIIDILNGGRKSDIPVAEGGGPVAVASYGSGTGE